MKKEKHWVKGRHKVIASIARPILAMFSNARYGITVQPCMQQRGRQCLILFNHQTLFDQFFVGMAFTGPIYFFATEDILSNGAISRVLNWAMAPIPIKKQTTDMKAVKTCLRVAKEGGTIALAPEGNRTYSGKTCYIKPTIAPLAKRLKLPLCLFRIEGGYGVHPRWSDAIRKGRMRGYVSKVIEPEELSGYTDEELNDLIQKELYVDETLIDGEYLSDKSAEYLERAIYVCPRCGLSTFESHGDTVECLSCGMKVRYLPTKELKLLDKDGNIARDQSPLGFRFVSDWYDYQCSFINHLNTGTFTHKPVYEEKADLYEVILYNRKKLLEEEVICRLYGDRLEIQRKNGMRVYPFDQISASAVLGRNKLNFYYGDKVYQIKGGKRFNALKYVNFYYRYQNIKKGDNHEQFLGL